MTICTDVLSLFMLHMVIIVRDNCFSQTENNNNNKKQQKHQEQLQQQKQ